MPLRRGPGLLVRRLARLNGRVFRCLRAAPRPRIVLNGQFGLRLFQQGARKLQRARRTFAGAGRFGGLDGLTRIAHFLRWHDRASHERRGE